MKKTDWDKLARRILRSQEEYAKKYCVDKPINISLSWRRKHYYGIIESIIKNEKESLFGLLPENYNEIVYLKRFPSPSQKLIDAMRKIDTNMLEISADDSLNLATKGNLIRREGDRIIRLTNEQIFYICMNREKYRFG